MLPCSVYQGERTFLKKKPFIYLLRLLEMIKQPPANWYSSQPLPSAFWSSPSAKGDGLEERSSIGGHLGFLRQVCWMAGYWLWCRSWKDELRAGGKPRACVASRVDVWLFCSGVKLHFCFFLMRKNSLKTTVAQPWNSFSLRFYRIWSSQQSQRG